MVEWSMDEIYECRKCPHTGPVGDFPKSRGKPTECKTCKRKRSKKHYDSSPESYAIRGPRRRFEAREIVNRIKQKDPCKDCGKHFHYCQMDFDHRDQASKRGQVSYMLMLGIETILTEIEKCDLVCANCHRDRTQLQVRGLSHVEPTTPSGLLLRKRTQFVNNVKDGRPCSDCRLPHPYWRLDFDHKNKTEKFLTVSRMKLSKYSEERILKEIGKCDLVCARCHRMRTFKRQREMRSGET